MYYLVCRKILGLGFKYYVVTSKRKLPKDVIINTNPDGEFLRKEALRLNTAIIKP